MRSSVTKRIIIIIRKKKKIYIYIYIYSAFNSIRNSVVVKKFLIEGVRKVLSML